MSEEELHGGGPGGGGPGGGPGGHSGGGPGGGPGGGGPGGGPGGHSGGGPGGQSGGGPGGQSGGGPGGTSGGGPGGTSGGGPGGSSRDWDAENARESAKEDADLLAAKQARAAGHVAAEDFYNTTSVPDAYGGTVQLPFRTPTGNVGPIQIPSEYSHEADAFQVGIQEQADEAQPNVKPYSGPQAGAAEPEDPEETFAEAKEKAEAYVHDSRQNQSAPDWQYKNQFEAKWGLPFPVPELDQGEQPYPGEDLARIPHDDPHTHDEVEVAD